MNEYESIQKFVASIKSFIENKEGLQFVTDTKIKVESKTHIIDGALIKNQEALAIFNFKSKSEKLVPKDFLFGMDFYEISYKFLVVTNGILSRVLDRYTDEIREFKSVQALLGFLIKVPSQETIEKNRIKIAEEIQKAVTTFLNADNKFKKFEKTKLEAHFAKEKILSELIFDTDGLFFHLSEDIRDLDNFENIFFQMLTKEVKSGEYIYRYTTLDTAFATINDKSARLNGIAGMNDTSEIGYVETYLDENFIPLQNVKEIQDLNKRFILCGSI